MEGHNFERIIGGTDEDKEKASAELQGYYDRRDKKLAEFEIEKTSEDLEVIKVTESMVNGIVSKYGGEIKDIPVDRIYVLKPGDMVGVTGNQFSGGVHRLLGSNIGVERNPSNFLFSSTIAHEMFHLKSYKSAYVKSPEQGAGAYRSGLTMFDIKDDDEKVGFEKEYFGDLEEAIVLNAQEGF